MILWVTWGQNNKNTTNLEYTKLNIHYHSGLIYLINQKISYCKSLSCHRGHRLQFLILIWRDIKLTCKTKILKSLKVNQKVSKTCWVMNLRSNYKFSINLSSDFYTVYQFIFHNKFFHKYKFICLTIACLYFILFPYLGYFLFSFVMRILMLLMKSLFKLILDTYFIYI